MLAIVINFGKEVIVTQVVERDGKRCCACYDRIDEKIDYDVLVNYEAVKKLMTDILVMYPDIKSSCLGITLSYGSGVFYQNLSVAKETLLDFAPASSEAEKEESIASVLNRYLTTGMKEKYGEFLSCIIASAEDSSDIGLSIGYIPLSVIDNLKKVCDELGIILVTISPLAYGIYNVINDFDRQLVFSSESAVITVNRDCIMAWEKPKIVSYNMEMVVSYFVDEIKRIYGAEVDDKIEMVDGRLASYVSGSAEIKEGVPLQVFSAIGCLLNYKGAHSRAGKEEETSNVTNSLRKFFKKQ